MFRNQTAINLSPTTTSATSLPQTHRGLGRIGRSLVVASFASVLTLGATMSTAAAATPPNTGIHGLAEVTCDALPGRLQAHLPMVASVPLSGGNIVTIGGWTGGGNHPQWVGVRVWLLRWDAKTARWSYTDQNGDGYYDHGPLLQTRVLSDGNLFDTSWWNADSSRPMAAGDSLFAIRYTGYYKVRVEYIWYADAYVGAGYDVLDSQSHYSMQFFNVSKPYCTF
jgi:hypothetical protein